MKKKLAIVTTHPIQYNAPLFRALALSSVMDIKVFYTWSQARESVKDAEFGREIVWDIPLLEGYEYEWIENVSRKPKQCFKGLVNPGLIPAVEKWGPDAVLVFGWNFQSHFQAMRHFHGKIPVWFRGDSTVLDNTGRLKSLARKILLRFVYSHVDKAFYVGTNNKEYFKTFGLKENQLTFAPHAIDNARFGQATAEQNAKRWRQQLQFEDDDIVLLYAGKISDNKNVVRFVESFIHYKAKKPGSRLKCLIVGNGADEEMIKSLVSPFVQYLPFQNQSKMPDLYCLGDVFVLPSRSETWGLGINEAMASGRTVVATEKVGCAVDLVKDGQTGFFFDLSSSNRNRDLFERLETAGLKAIGERNRTYIQKWCYRAIVSAIESEIESI